MSASPAIKALIDLKDDLPFTPTATLAQHAWGNKSTERKPGVEAEEDSSHMAGRLSGRTAILRYIEAGNARFTVRSKKTGVRLTFRAARPKEDNDHESTARPAWQRGGQQSRARPIWISVLTGQDNVSQYEFLGTIWPSANGYSIKRSPKSRITENAGSFIAMVWLCRALNGASNIEQAEVWHEGRCGRCGRVLTVPESVESGFGPECIGRL